MGRGDTMRQLYPSMIFRRSRIPPEKLTKAVSLSISSISVLRFLAYNTSTLIYL